MPTSSLRVDLDRLVNQRQICVIGAAVVDVIAAADSLPRSGGDIELRQQGVNVGGCALNIAITLSRLGLDSLNALPLGTGVWADIITRALREKNITSGIHVDSGDNGWCLALVEPNGERTFLSVSGVENQWSPAMLAQLVVLPGALVYLSGYQLASAAGDILLAWLATLPAGVTLFIDLGPRITHLAPAQWEKLLALRPIVSLNRQEAEHVYTYLSPTSAPAPFGAADIDALAGLWRQRYRCPLIIRMDSEGAYYFDLATAGRVAAVEATVVDTIGAGDSHAGGVLAGLASGWSLRDAVALGNSAASFVVSHRGGDCAPRREELRQYLRDRGV